MPAEKVRIDKWLWSIRIFKTRSLATNACKSGDVKVGEKKVKPAHLIQINETINVRKNGFDMTFLVKELISKRVSATLAGACYENLTPVEELNKYKDWFIGKARPEIRAKGTGRPTKRNRREIDHFKKQQFDEE